MSMSTARRVALVVAFVVVAASAFVAGFTWPRRSTEQQVRHVIYSYVRAVDDRDRDAVADLAPVKGDAEKRLAHDGPLGLTGVRVVRMQSGDVPADCDVWWHARDKHGRLVRRFDIVHPRTGTMSELNPNYPRPVYAAPGLLAGPCPRQRR